MARSRGAALADLNLDGLLDLVVVNRRAPMEVYQNTSPAPGNWLALRLAQPGPNVDAVGAWIDLKLGARTLSREITVGGGHAGGSMLAEHFGLGEAEQAEIKVTWPDGSESGWVTFDAGATYRVMRSGDGLVVEAL
jgi:hypothetical protein